MKTIEEAVSVVLAALGEETTPVAVFSKQDLLVELDYDRSSEQDFHAAFSELNGKIVESGLVVLPYYIQGQQTLAVITKHATAEKLNDILPVMLPVKVLDNLAAFGASSIAERMKL